MTQKHRQLIGALPCQVIGWRCSKQRVGGPHHKRVLVAAKNNERYSITKHTHIPRKQANTRDTKKKCTKQTQIISVNLTDNEKSLGYSFNYAV